MSEQPIEMGEENLINALPTLAAKESVAPPAQQDIVTVEEVEEVDDSEFVPGEEDLMATMELLEALKVKKGEREVQALHQKEVLLQKQAELAALQDKLQNLQLLQAAANGAMFEAEGMDEIKEAMIKEATIEEVEEAEAEKVEADGDEDNDDGRDNAYEEMENMLALLEDRQKALAAARARRQVLEGTAAMGVPMEQSPEKVTTPSTNPIMSATLPVRSAPTNVFAVKNELKYHLEQIQLHQGRVNYLASILCDMPSDQPPAATKAPIPAPTATRDMEHEAMSIYKEEAENGEDEEEEEEPVDAPTLGPLEPAIYSEVSKLIADHAENPAFLLSLFKEIRAFEDPEKLVNDATQSSE